MHILQDFNNLWHNYNLLHNLFKDVRYFNKSFFVSNNLNGDVHDSVDNLEDLLNVVNITNSFFKLLQDDCPLDYFLDFSHSFILVSNFHDLFVLLYNLFNTLHYHRDFHNLLHDVLNVSVHVDELRNKLFDFNDFGNLDDLLFNAFDLVYLWNCD